MLQWPATLRLRHGRVKRQHWRQLQWHRTNHEYEPHPACGMVLAHQLQTYARRDASDDDNWHFHGQSRLWVSCVAQRVRSSLSLRFIDDSDCIVKHACDPSPWLWCRLAHLTPLVSQANAAHELYLVRGSAKCHVNTLVESRYCFSISSHSSASSIRFRRLAPTAIATTKSLRAAPLLWPPPG